jgi:hypothetical protein
LGTLPRSSSEYCKRALAALGVVRHRAESRARSTSRIRVACGSVLASVQRRHSLLSCGTAAPHTQASRRTEHAAKPSKPSPETVQAMYGVHGSR